MTARRTLLLIAIAACAVTLSGCGYVANVKSADSEAIYVNVGQLKYQVQFSRELNPYDTEDASYLEGLSPATVALTPAQAWFGVFMLVLNEHGKAYQAAYDYYMTDTAGDVFRPTPVKGTNPFAYHSVMVAPYDQLPLVGSLAADGPTSGAALLFKIPLASFDDRPLVLHIVDPSNPHSESIVTLDV
ncbi:MAG TPA: hypothetical protein VG165_04005 [Solirubrobacteraceae bacterium]|jgi:hypothetical protein|nr:hypothetical protein [Solirubrobacteraceae bacterium]